MKSTFIDQNQKVTPENIHEAIQQAIELEIATIPTYLYTYYSLNRVPDQEQIKGDLFTAFTNQGIPPEKAKLEALDMSVEMMVFANKAGALIMSVAVEEMLHLSLSSNLAKSMGRMPELVGNSPASWPAYLPGHEPKFYINLAKFSLTQLLTFLKIETPDTLTPDKEAYYKSHPIDYTTIGEFYKQIEKCLEHHFKEVKYYQGRPQIVPGKGVYGSDNINTLYYDKQHRPKFVNARDSYGIVEVTSLESALQAVQVIRIQGEGSGNPEGLKPDGTPDCSRFAKKTYDDKDDRELTHFDKFSEVYCHYQDIIKRFESVGINQTQLEGYFVRNIATNPVTADYPSNIQPISVFLNAVYSYLFVMIEACYTDNKENTQFEIFMFGVHKTMIWILDGLCGWMYNYTYMGPDQKCYLAAPTFENYEFNKPATPKSQLLKLCDAATIQDSSMSYYRPLLEALPDIHLR